MSAPNGQGYGVTHQAAAANFARQLLQNPSSAAPQFNGQHLAPLGMPPPGLPSIALPASGMPLNSSIPPSGIREMEMFHESQHHLSQHQMTQQQAMIGGDPTRVIRNASDASFNERKIFIGGLNYDTTNELLKEFFEEKYGTVDSAEIMRDRTTNISRGFGFVIFADCENVDRAVLDSPFECYNSKCDIRRAQPKSERAVFEAGASPTAYRGSVHSKESLVGKVFIGGLDFEVKEPNITAYFSQFGAIKSVEMMENRSTGQPRGFCFLTFEDPECAKNSTGRHPDLSRSCEVKLAVPRPHNKAQLFPGIQDVSQSGPYATKPLRHPGYMVGGHGGTFAGQHDLNYGNSAVGTIGGPIRGHTHGMRTEYNGGRDMNQGPLITRVPPTVPKMLEKKYSCGDVYEVISSQPNATRKCVWGVVDQETEHRFMKRNPII
eukprot:GHVH01007124.1.p1 GENE.GHVH01007124.1~~GHVH01007124.1.p1  ORF type:complete len:434 (-),score=36.52 GHVH01007124.1:309-1610(-)